MALIYCVEDDDGIRELISCALKSGGYEVKAFPKAKPFYEEIRNKEPSLVLLDIMLPDEDGYSILSKLKKDSHTQDVPVIMLTAKSSEFDKVTALNAGADDYITKPFGVMETVARVKAVLRRSNTARENTTVYTAGNLTVSLTDRTVTVGGAPVALTFKEFELLYLLLSNRGAVMSRDLILDRIWGFSFDGETRTVDVHVRTLRQKLGECGNLIETVRGIGYKFKK